MLRYEEHTLMELTDGMIRNTIITLLKTAAKEVTMKIIGSIYGALKDIVKQNVDRREADIITRLRFDRCTSVRSMHKVL